MKNTIQQTLTLTFFLLFQTQIYAEPGRVGIIAALPQELRAISRHIKNAEEQILNDAPYLVGRIDQTDVVVALSGIGKVNAAMVSQNLVSTFKVKAIVFCGVAGGIDPGLKIGDIVVSHRAFQHDVGYFGEKFILQPVGIFPQFGIGKGTEDKIIQTISSGKMVAIEREFQRSRGLLLKIRIKDKDYRPNIVTGVVATGDQFIANEVKKKELQALGATVVDMEGGAVAQVASKSSVPFILIRAVSDTAGSEAGADFKNLVDVVADNNEILIRQFLKEAKKTLFSP